MDFFIKYIQTGHIPFLNSIFGNLQKFQTIDKNIDYLLTTRYLNLFANKFERVH